MTAWPPNSPAHEASEVSIAALMMTAPAFLTEFEIPIFYPPLFQ
jgi:hypothetical protein